MKSWSSFVRSTIKELRSGSEVPDYFGNLIPLVSRNPSAYFPPNNNNNLAEYKDDDDLISIDAVQVQNSRYAPQQNRQQLPNNNNFFSQSNNNNRINNDFNNNGNFNYQNKFGNQQANSNYYDIYQNNQNDIYEDHSYLPQQENLQRFNNRNNTNDSNINYNEASDNYNQNQQKPVSYYAEDENNAEDYKNDIMPQNRGQSVNNSNDIKENLVNPDFEPSKQAQKQQQQSQSQSPVRQNPQPQNQQHDLSDSFNESPNRNLIQQNVRDTQSTPEGTKQPKEKAYIPETPEMVDYPSSASDVPWQDVPKSSPQPFPSESLINAIDQIGVYDEKQEETSQKKQQVQQQRQKPSQKQQQAQQEQEQEQDQEQSFNDYAPDQDQQQQEQSFNDYSHDQHQQEQSFNEYSHDQPNQQLQHEQSFNEYSHDQQQASRFEDEDNDLADDDDNNNSIDEIIMNEKIDINNEEENSDITPVPFSERFRILSGGIIDRYWSHIDTEVPRIVPQSKILTSFKASKFIKYKNAMDTFAKKVEGKKHHLRFKQVDQA